MPVSVNRASKRWRISVALAGVALVLGILLHFFEQESNPANGFRPPESPTADAARMPTRSTRVRRGEEPTEKTKTVNAPSELFVVEGRVVDEFGHPLTDVRVQLTESSRENPSVVFRVMPSLISGSTRPPRKPIVGTAVSDAAGRFRLQPSKPGLFHLNVDLAGYRPYESSTLEISGDHPREYVDVRLMESADQRCVVEDAAGRPLQGVRIDYVVPHLPALDTRRGRSILRSTMSDDEGRFLLRGYGGRARANRSYVRLSKAGYVPRSHSFGLDTPSIDSEGRMHFVLNEGRRLEIRFVPHGGVLNSPLRFTVSMIGQGFPFKDFGKSDVKGFAQLDTLPPGTELRVRILDGGWHALPRGGSATHLDSVRGFAYPIPKTGDVSLDVDVVRSKRLRARIVDIDTGEGVRGIDVVWGRGLEWDVMAGIAGRAITGDDGSFEIGDIGTAPKQLMILSSEWRFTAGGDLNAALSTVEAIATQIDSAHAPKRDAGDARSVALRQISPFMIEIDPPPDEVSVPVTLPVRRGKSFVGRILAPNGVPVEGATIAPSWGTHLRELTVLDHLNLRSRWGVLSDSEGRFRITTPTSDGTLLIRHSTYATKEVQMPSGAGSSHDLGDITLSSLVPVLFRVVRDDGVPVGGVRLQIRPGNQMAFTDLADYRFVTTDEDGWAQSLLPEGPASLQWTLPARESLLIPHPSLTRALDVAPPETKVTLRFVQGHLLRCTVLDESDRPAAHFTLTIVRLDAQGNVIPGKFPIGAVVEGKYAMGTLTDAGGRAELLVPYPGRYRVVGGTRSGRTAGDPGGPTTLDFLADPILTADGPPSLIRVRNAP